MSRSTATASSTFQVSPALRHDVRNYLRNQIYDGSLEPGDRIVESRLARELGISQTPVREALRELEQMGLVVSYPNRGSSVRKIEPRDAGEMYSLRAHLEDMAIRLALPKLSEDDIDGLDDLVDQMLAAARADDPDTLTEIDTRFHETIIEHADHHLLLRTWQGISPLNWTMMTVIRLRDRNLEELAERHRPIVKALRAHDVERAVHEIRDHVLVLGERVVQDLAAMEKKLTTTEDADGETG